VEITKYLHSCLFRANLVALHSRRVGVEIESDAHRTIRFHKVYPDMDNIEFSLKMYWGRGKDNYCFCMYLGYLITLREVEVPN